MHRGVDLLEPLLALLAVLCAAGCLLGILAALKRQRRRAHQANAAVLGLCTAGSTLALTINPDTGAHWPGVLLLLVLAGLTLACLGAPRRAAPRREVGLVLGGLAAECGNCRQPALSVAGVQDLLTAPDCEPTG